jgi:hypothetical protein
MYLNTPIKRPGDLMIAFYAYVKGPYSLTNILYGQSVMGKSNLMKFYGGYEFY